MVEGGTLLRCYTSQRGIEGSNPSSSALEALRLQVEHDGKEAGWERPRPYYTNAARIPSFLAKNAAFAIVHLCPLPYKLWSPARCSMASLNQRISVPLL